MADVFAASDGLYATPDGDPSHARQILANTDTLFVRNEVVSFGERTLFVAGASEISNIDSGRQLWVTDGSESTLLATTPSGVTSDDAGYLSGSAGIVGLTAVGGLAVFAARDGGIGDWGQIWVSDGTAAGTVALPATGLSITGVAATAGGLLVASDSGLIRIDGTVAGTRSLALPRG